MAIDASHEKQTRHVIRAAAALLQDLRQAVRLFVRRPGVSALVVITLAIGIAATTIAFSVADAVLWHPLPFRDADRLVRVTATVPHGAEASLDLWPARNQLFDGVYPFALDSGIVDAGGDPQAVTIGLLAPGLLDAIGVRPIAGRAFGPSDARPGSPAIVISAALWRRMQPVGSAPAEAIGRVVRLEGTPRTIVGVMPEGFDFPVGRVMLWRAYVPDAAATRLTALGKLKGGVTLDRAQTLARAPANTDASSPLVRNVQVTSFVRTNRTTSLALQFVLGAGALLLLIAVTNTANVLLADAVRRDSELAIRVSLGASWPRLARQMATEAIVASAAAAVVALLASAWALGGLVKTIPYLISFQALRPIALDWRALSFAAATATLAGLGASWLSMMRARRLSAQTALRGQTSGIPGQARTRSALTIAQIAVTLALVACAGVLTNGLAQIGSLAPGFDPSRLVHVVVQIPTWRYTDDAETQAALVRARDEAAALPTVADATISHAMPPGLGSVAAKDIEIDGAPTLTTGGEVAEARVDDRFFSTMGIPIVAGRGIDSRDHTGAQRVAVVSRAFAELLMPNGGAIGRRFRESKGDPWLTVVGIAGNISNAGVDVSPTQLAFYTPRSQTTAWWFEGLIVRTRVAPADVVPDLRAVFRRAMPDAPVIEVTTGVEAIADSNSRVRFATGLMSAFAGVALVLALIGVYAAFWYLVRQRTREIGMRLALGAAPADILRMIVGLAARLALIGLLAGLPLALIATRAVRSLLIGVSPNEPATLGVVAVGLAAAAIAAAYLPARHASRVDPVVALRTE
jgi:putative ABC transport system permease protein